MNKILIPDHELEFTYARSSGPGGQNVNKTESKVILHWNIIESDWIPEDVRIRFETFYPSRITSSGEVVIHSDESRDRLANELACIKKLTDMLKTVWVAPKKRVATKPSRSSKMRRVEGKRRRSDIKKGRKSISKGYD